jgi:hypothetical protein
MTKNHGIIRSFRLQELGVGAKVSLLHPAMIRILSRVPQRLTLFPEHRAAGASYLLQQCGVLYLLGRRIRHSELDSESSNKKEFIFDWMPDQVRHDNDRRIHSAQLMKAAIHG